MRYGRILIDKFIETPEGDTVNVRIDPDNFRIYFKISTGVEFKVSNGGEVVYGETEALEAPSEESEIAIRVDPADKALYGKLSDGTEIPLGSPFSINGVGRSFSNPTVFTQTHIYSTPQEAWNAFLFPANAPSVSLTAQFRLNGSPTFQAVGNVPKGTIITEVKLTLGAARADVNSADVNQINVSGHNITPIQHNFGAAPSVSGKISTDTVANAPTVNTSRSYSATSKSTDNKVSSAASTSFSFLNYTYAGVGTAVAGAINESFIRGLASKSLGSSHRTSVTQSPAGDQYIYYAYPSSFGKRVFEFLSADQTNPEDAIAVKVRTQEQIDNGVAQNDASVDTFWVIRSLSAGLGGGSPYTFQIGTVG